jgi:uncharacterized protein YcnI
MNRLMIAGALLLATPASAHVVLSPDASSAGAYYAGVLRVGHGCDGQATTALHVEIPAAATDAKPQPKPGWRVEITRAGGRVTALRWTGLLPADQFESFGIMLKLDPAASGMVYLPVVQSCGEAQKRWTDIPPPGAAWTSVPSPAPVLTIAPAAADEHAGH